MLNPSPEKVLARFPAVRMQVVDPNTGTTGFEAATAPKSNAAVDYALDDFCQLTDNKEAHRLKRAIMEAFDAPYNTILTHRAKNTMLRAEQERITRATRKTCTMPKKGNLRVSCART